MRTARCHEHGAPSVVVIEEVPDPVPGPGDAVVRIAAAAVNFPDVLMIAGHYQWKPPLPFTPGSEFAGTVEAVGPGVDDVAPGDRVLGAAMVGAFAERIAVPAHLLRPVPDGVDTETAAAFGVAHQTAYHALRSIADVGPGDWVVVLGAAGGVGLAAVELAHLRGARVLAAASSAEKLALCRARGAEATVDYTTEDLKLRIREITGSGADVVVDPVGGPYAEAALRSTRAGGWFITVGFASGEIPKIPLNLLLLKGSLLTGFTIEGFATHRPEDARRDRAELLQLLREGRLHPYVSATYPLAQTAHALADVGERRATGKVLVLPPA